MQRIPITLKLALTLAVPIVVLAFATTLGVRSASRERDEVRRQTELAGAAVGPAGLLSTLQNERVWVLTDIFGFQDAFNPPVTSDEEAYEQTDAARGELDRQVAGGNSVVAGAFSAPLAGLDDLDRIREETGVFRSADHDLVATVEFAFDIWERYNALLAPFYDATSGIVGDIEDAQLREGARLSDNVARGIEAFTQAASRTVEFALLTENGVDTRAEIAELSRLQLSLERYAEAIAAAEDGSADVPSVPSALAIIDGVDALIDQALSTGRMSMDELFASIEAPQGEGLYALQDEVHAFIDARADRLESRAETRRLRLVTLAVAGMAFVIVLNVLVSRSVARPLRSLTGQAKEVARRRLPAAVEQLLDVPVPPAGDGPGGSGDGVGVPMPMPMPEIEPVTVDSADELAEVAGALNTVQTSVVDLAAQQAVYRRNIADLFVSLDGRNQELLRRQVGLIGELDAATIAPTARASFSQLDHLATQMRRNTESLLAVAGVDARRVWQASVDVDEIVGYAQGSVADTRRLVVHDLEPAVIAGAAAKDVVRLLAELIESALEQSADDDRPVEIRGGPRGETGGYWLAVVDYGAVPTASPSSSSNGSHPTAAQLAQLAERAGVTVRPDSSAGWGVTVTIDIPTNLMVPRPSEARTSSG